MHKLLVLTVDGESVPPDPSIIVVRPGGKAETYVFVDTIDRLAHYRHAEVPEEQALELIA